jgi:hypothetical protein
MKLLRCLAFCLLVSVTLWGQSAPAPNSAPVANPAPVPQPAPAFQPNPATLQSRMAGQPQTPVEANSLYLGQMKRMMDQIKAMQTKLDEMKVNTAKVKDPTLKQQLQLDNELWAMMLTQLQAITISTAQSRSFGRFGAGEQAYRQQRQSLRQPPTPPDTAAPPALVAPESKPAAPTDHQ